MSGRINANIYLSPADLAAINGKLKTGTKRATPEADAQAELFAWKERNVRRIPALKWLHSSGNGYNLSTPAARTQANRTGRVKGIWDVFLPYGKGLYIEMKAPGRKLTMEQEAFREENRERFYFEMCYSASEAIAAICGYLGIDDPEATT